MKNLLVVTALLEAVTGVALIVSPAPPVSLHGKTPHADRRRWKPRDIEKVK